MSDFLPKDYNVPVGQSPFMSFEDGENVIRALDSVIVGYTGWRKAIRDDGKETFVPERFKMGEEPADVTKFRNERLQHFWAFPVWNYAIGKVQLLELTQKTIMKAVVALKEDEDWGTPLGYDLKITKSGESLQTEYAVNPKPKAELSEEVEAAWREVQVRGFDAEKIFEGKNPFVTEEEVE